MRLMHLGGARLGLDPESEKPFGRQRAAEFRETFQKAVEKAAEESCDLLLISGGLFDHQPVTEELETVNRLFLSVPSLHIVIAAGKDDPVRRESPVKSFDWAPNVHFVLSGNLQRISFPAFGTAVYAASATEKGMAGTEKLCAQYRSQFDTFQESASGEEAIRILLSPAPCGETDKAADAETAEKWAELLTPFSYAAFGGAAEHTEYLRDKAACPGVLEPASMSETGEHGVLLCDISQASGKVLRLAFEPLAQASYVPLLVNVTEATTGEALYRLLEKEMETRGKKNIYRLRLCGKRSADTDFDLVKLAKEYRIEELLDETVPQYDFQALFEEHPQDMIGFYISRLGREKNELSTLEKKAMHYGIDALLKTAAKKEN